MTKLAENDQSLEELEALLAKVQAKIAEKSGGPTNLLNALIAERNLKNFAELGRLLDVSDSTLSGIKAGRLNVSDALIIKIHEVFDWSISRIKAALRAAA